MRELPDGMQEHQDSGATTLCNCWRLLRNDGVALGFTDHDLPLQFDNTVFESASGFTAARMETHLGFAVGGTEIAGALVSSFLDETGLINGLFDDARVEMWLVNWSATAQRILLDVASIGEVRRCEHGFTAELRSAAHRFDQERGRVYQRSCGADLGDEKCRVDTGAETFRTVAAVTKVNSPVSIEIDAAGFPDGWFSGGRLRFLGGVNSGAWQTIESSSLRGTSCLLRLWTQPGAPIVITDQVEVFAGCDKTFETCRGKFNNTDNFRGFPHIPGNSALLTHPGAGEGALDGGSLFRSVPA
jgi:uncharacterized phage protein (TIGR02218 family)